MLQGSTDGTSWKDLDKRSGQTFAWDKQTRVFSVQAPKAYAKYRLVSTEAATLAEIELIS